MSGHLKQRRMTRLWKNSMGLSTLHHLAQCSITLAGVCLRLQRVVVKPGPSNGNHYIHAVTVTTETLNGFRDLLLCIA